jgi:hypothetical protein
MRTWFHTEQGTNLDDAEWAPPFAGPDRMLEGSRALAMGRQKHLSASWRNASIAWGLGECTASTSSRTHGPSPVLHILRDAHDRKKIKKAPRAESMAFLLAPSSVGASGLRALERVGRYEDF